MVDADPRLLPLAAALQAFPNRRAGQRPVPQPTAQQAAVAGHGARRGAVHEEGGPRRVGGQGRGGGQERGVDLVAEPRGVGGRDCGVGGGDGAEEHRVDVI